jgi:hypothetical protein
MEVERPAGLLILVDTWADGGEGESVLDLCCGVAASVAVQAQRSGHDVLLGAAERGHFEQPLFMGQRAALTWLAGLAAPGGLPLSQVIDRTAAATPGPTAVIVVPSWQANAGSVLGRAVAGLVRAGGPVVAVVVDAGRFGSRAATLPPGELADLERALVSAGAAVRRVEAADDIGPALGRPAGDVPRLSVFGARR